MATLPEASKCATQNENLSGYKLREYQLNLGVHYHMRRQQFFEKWHRLTGVVSLVFSTSAIAVITNNTFGGIVCSAIVAIFQCFDLIVDTRGKAELHNSLRRKYIQASTELIDLKSNYNDASNNDIDKSIKIIEMSEPPIKKILLELAHNDACRSLGYDKENLHSVNWFVAKTCNIIDWSSSIKD
jgi:hypothetical protein